MQDERRIADALPGLIWSTLPSGEVDYLNQQWCDYTGLSLEAARGWGWRAAICPDDLPRLEEFWMSLIVTGTEGAIEARIRRADGEQRWFLFRARPLRAESGEIIRWYGTNTDIDSLTKAEEALRAIGAQKRAEAALRQSEAFLTEGQRLSLTGSFSWRVSTDELTWSNQTYLIYDVDPALVPSFDLIATRMFPEEAASFFELVGRARLDGNDFEFEQRLRTAGNSIKYVRVVAHGYRDDSGQLEYIGAIQDITEQRLSADTLGKVRSELAHVARVSTLGALTASIAHEVNQPLSGIITNASTCLRMLADEPANVVGARATAQRIIRDGNRAAQVITRLRQLFKKTDKATEWIDLNEATREVLLLLANELLRTRAIVHAEYANDLPLVKGDRVQLQQVVLNLILNAAEAMAGVDVRPRLLSIRTERREGDGICLSVADSGVGFDAGDIDRIFDAFYTTKSSGMGIGLSVSRSIIQSHDGRLWAELNDGPGATFCFSIPRMQEVTASAVDVVAEDSSFCEPQVAAQR